MTITVDYDEVNAELMAVHAGVLAAECHGFICGYFCASNSIVAEVWQDYLLGEIDEDVDLSDCFAMLGRMASQISEELLADDISFSLLLPDDESSISERTSALAEWSAGFISGLGIGGLADPSKLEEECDEFIKDVVSISRMETTMDESEDAESDLFEIIEYIRVGVIMLHQTCHNLGKVDVPPEVLH